MELAVILYSKEARRLFEAVLDGEEFDSLSILLKKIQLGQFPLGRTELRIKGHTRFLIVFTYVSIKLGAIYILSYHLERLGEPTPAQLGTVDRYIQELKAEEA